MRRLSALFLAVLVPHQSANAQNVADFETFACDTPGGRYSRYQRSIGTSPFHLMANVKINELRSGSEWLPVVNVMLNGGGSERRIGFRLIGDRKTKATTIYLVFPGMSGGQGIAAGQISLDAPINLSLSLTEQAGQLSVNGDSRTGPGLKAENWTLDTSCSSVDAHVNYGPIGQD